MFSVIVDIDGLTRKFNTLAESAADLEPPLGKFGGYLRKKALERYKAQDFDPLAESTVSHRAQKGLHSLEGKLKRDVRKAIGRSAPKSPPGLIARILGKSAMADITGSQSRGAKNRLAVLSEFQRRHKRGGSTVEERAAGKPLSLKQMVSLGAREDRAVAKSVGKPILGALPRSLMVEIGQGSVTLISRTKTEWSEVHNAGGEAGHGAKIPKRETVRLDESDMEVFAEILKEHLLLAFEDSDA